MKRLLAPTLCLMALAFSARADEWHLQKSLTDKTTDALSDLKYWVKAGETEPGSGAPQSADDLYADRGLQLRMYGVSFTGNSLRIGEAGRSTTVVHDYGALNMPQTSEGLFLVNGYWWLNRNNYTFTIGGPVTVASPAATGDKPFTFLVSDTSHLNVTLDFTGTLHGAKGTSLVVGPQPGQAKISNCASNFTCRVADLTDYHGTLVVTSNYENVGASWGTKLEIGSATTSSDCTINAGFGATITTKDNGIARVGSISFGPDSRLLLRGTKLADVGCISAAGQVTIADGPLPVWASFDLSSEDGFRKPILVASIESDFTASDFALDARATNPSYDSLAPDFAATHLEVVVDEAAGTRTLYLVSAGVVSQTSYYTGEDKNGDPQPSSLTNAAAWSSGVAALDDSACHAYYTTSYLRTLNAPGEDYVFPNADHPAEALWLKGGHLRLTVASFSVPKLWTSGGSSIQTTHDAPDWVVVKAGRIHMVGNYCTLKSYLGQRLTLRGEISGSAPIECRGYSTGSPQATYELDGPNTNFTGRILITQDERRPQYVTFDVKHPTLLVSDGRNLGGRMPEFDPRALTLEMLAQVVVSGDEPVTLADGLNRGVYVQGGGRFLADEGRSIDIQWPILLSGKLWKEGVGTLTLSGAMKHEAEDGEIVDVPRANSNLFEIVAGTVRVRNADALAGVETTVDAGATLRLVLDPENAELTRYGIKNTTAAVPFAQAGSGKLRFEVDGGAMAAPAADATVTNALITVSDAAAPGLRAILSRRLAIWKDRKSRIVELHLEEGLTTFAAETCDSGMTIILR